jgi:Ca2+-transporting ATPase
MAVSDVVAALDVVPSAGLSTAQAARRLERDGPNRLADAPGEPLWRAFQLIDCVPSG